MLLSATVLSDEFIIYGAAGYTGRLITQEALRRGLRPLLAGRDERKLAAVAEPLGLSYRVASLDDASALDAALADVAVVLHAAGPFSQTAQPMLDACLRVGRHYLDVSGEVRVIEALRARDREARARGICVLPAVGCDVVASDCLIAHVARRLPSAHRLELGVSGLAYATRGSWRTLVEHAGFGAARRAGVLTPVAAGSLRRRFDYGAGPRESLSVVWGDVATAYYTTGIPNIDVYFEATPVLEAILAAGRAFAVPLRSAPWQTLMKAHAELLPEGPSPAERAAQRMVFVAELSDASGRRACARLRTPEAYTFTAVTSVELARRVLAGDRELGFQTPARVYGPDFVLGFDGVVREDLE